MQRRCFLWIQIALSLVLCSFQCICIVDAEKAIVQTFSKLQFFQNLNKFVVLAINEEFGVRYLHKHTSTKFWSKKLHKMTSKYKNVQKMEFITKPHHWLWIIPVKFLKKLSKVWNIIEWQRNYKKLEAWNHKPFETEKFTAKTVVLEAKQFAIRLWKAIDFRPDIIAKVLLLSFRQQKHAMDFRMGNSFHNDTAG